MTVKDFTFNPLKLFSPRYLLQETPHEELHAKEVCEGIDLSEGLLITLSKLVEMTRLLSKYVVSGAAAQCDKITQLGQDVHTQEQILTRCLLGAEVKQAVRSDMLRFPYRLERVGDMLESILGCCREKAGKEVPFSDKAYGELEQMFGLLLEMMNDLRVAFTSPNKALLEGITEKRGRLIDMTEEFKLAHWQRMEAGFCHAGASSMYRTMLDSFEGAAEYIGKIAASLIALQEHAPEA